MYDDLTSIEGSYGCYAEYLRTLEEKEEREYADKLQNAERYKKNKEKIAKASCILWYGNEGRCNGCSHAVFDTQRDEGDDFVIVICNAPDGFSCKDREYAMLPYAYSFVGEKVAGDNSFMEDHGFADTICFEFKLKEEADEFLATKCKNNLYTHPNGNTYKMSLKDCSGEKEAV